MDEYPTINGEKPDLLYETSVDSWNQVETTRATYEIDDIYVTIKPVYSDVQEESENDRIKWKLLTGETTHCASGPEIGPFESVEKAVEYIQESL